MIASSTRRATTAFCVLCDCPRISLLANTANKTYASDDFRLGAFSPSSPSKTRCRGSLTDPLLAVRGIVDLSSPGFSFRDAFRRKAMLSMTGFDKQAKDLIAGATRAISCRRTASEAD
jgi:hypothetical protein